MKAMIFAAGLGTRLKPITDTLPKALVPVCGKPLIEHICRKLMDAGINEAVVNVHHFADKIEDWASHQDWSMNLAFSDERAQLLETGGAIHHARHLLEGCGHFLVHNVDILSDADLMWLATQVKPEAIATLLASERRVCYANIGVRSGKQDLVEQQNSAPNAKFCLYPLRPPTEEGANAKT